MASSLKEAIMHKPALKHHEDPVKNDTRFARLKRWIYRNQSPNWLARIVNRVWTVLSAVGLTTSSVVTLEVRGRTSISARQS
jgi:hypothetical protein